MIREVEIERGTITRQFERSFDVGPEGHQDASDARPSVVALVPRGEVIRNFVYTSTFDYIAQEADLSLISVTPNSELEQFLKSQYSRVFQLPEIEETKLVGLQREILDMAHGRWLWSEAARERWRLRSFEAKTVSQRAKLWSKRLACYPFANRGGLKVLSKIERASSRWLCTTDKYLNLYKELKPSLVFNGSHVHSRIATQAVQAAQWLGIPTATFIFSWDNLTSQGRIMLPYDHYLVWNEAIRQQFLEMYDWIRPDQVFVTGTPQFDLHFRPEFYWSRQEFCARVGADPSRPIVLYSTGMANHMPGEPEIVEGIADMLKALSVQEKPQLLVRVYPKDLTGRFEELKRRRPDILFPAVPWEVAWLTPRYDDSYLLTNTLRHAAVGINVASTVSLELCMFDKPVINVGYNPPSVGRDELDYARYYEFDHYRPIVQSGAVRVAWSQAEMADLISHALAEPGEGSEARRSLIRNMFGESLDGRVGSRIAGLLVELARRHRRDN
jgi:hypothetical protein